MAEKLDPTKELTTWEDIAYSNMIQNEAVFQFSEYQSHQEKHLANVILCAAILKLRYHPNRSDVNIHLHTSLNHYD